MNKSTMMKPRGWESGSRRAPCSQAPPPSHLPGPPVGDDPGQWQTSAHNSSVCSGSRWCSLARPRCRWSMFSFCCEAVSAPHGAETQAQPKESSQTVVKLWPPSRASCSARPPTQGHYFSKPVGSVYHGEEAISECTYKKSVSGI